MSSRKNTVYAVRVTKTDRGGYVGPGHKLVSDMGRAVAFTRDQADDEASESRAAGNTAEVVPHQNQELGQ